MTYFKTHFQHMSGGTEKICKNSQDSQPPGRDLNPGPPQHEAYS